MSKFAKLYPKRFWWQNFTGPPEFAAEVCRAHGLIHHVRLRESSHLPVEDMRWLEENIIEVYSMYTVNHLQTGERQDLFLACSNEHDAFQIKMRLG